MPIVGVYFCKGNLKVRGTSLSLLQTLSPDYIWKLDTSKDEKNKAGSLVEALLNVGVPSIGLEIPDLELITNEQIKKVTLGLIRVIESLNRSTPSETDNKIPPIISRVFAISQTDGVFVPEIQINQMVHEGSFLGKIFSLTSLESENVVSPTKGAVIFILNNTFVKEGERVAVIGKEERILPGIDY